MLIKNTPIMNIEKILHVELIKRLRMELNEQQSSPLKEREIFVFSIAYKSFRKN